jgi:NAD dependent epimerase/dehydratase family enzyme
VNLVAPQSVTNRRFTKALARAVHRPALLPLPAFAARLAFGEMADELLLASTRVVPKRLAESGFRFEHPELSGALEHLLSRPRTSP